MYWGYSGVKLGLYWGYISLKHKGVASEMTLVEACFMGGGLLGEVPCRGRFLISRAPVFFVGGSSLGPSIQKDYTPPN